MEKEILATIYAGTTAELSAVPENDGVVRANTDEMSLSIDKSAFKIQNAPEIIDGTNTKVKIEDGKIKIEANAVDNLTSTSAKDMLSANQGRVLDGKITAFPTTQPNFSEANVTTAAFSGNLATGAILGTGWDAFPVWSHAAGNTATLPFPVAIANGESVSIKYTQTGTSSTNTFDIIFADSATATSGQTAKAGIYANGTVTAQANADYSWVNILPSSGWVGTFTLEYINTTSESHSASMRLHGDFSTDAWYARVISEGKI